MKQLAKPQINLSNRFCTKNSQIITYFEPNKAKFALKVNV